MVTEARPRRLSVRSIRTCRELGAAIRQSRKDQGLTQAALAAKARVGRQWLSELETGKQTAEVGRVLWVLDALDLNITLREAADSDPDTFDLNAYVDTWAD